MKILVIEDEKPAANLLIKLIKKHFGEVEIIGNFDTITKTIQWLRENSAPTLIFCDIQLADGLSFEIFEEVKLSTPIIFTTA
ncbi:MAG: response regulator, partial [Algoriphagus sp.]